MAAITFREATLEDKDDVISINDDVYDGRDYLPSRYEETITCPNTTSYVVLMDNKIVGFLAMLLLDDGLTVVTRAGRSSPKVAGQGVYKRLNSYVMHEAEKKGTVVNAFTAVNINRAIYSESFRMKNKEILVKPMMRFLVDTMALSASFKDDKIHLHEPDDKDMASYFSNKFSRAYLFPKDRIISSWVPYKLLSSNLPHLRRPESNRRFFSDVDVGTDGNMSGLLSISTTVPSQNPPFLTDLDIYGTDAKSLMKHILYHFKFARTIADGVVSLLIFVEPDFDKAEIHNAFEELNVKESVWIDPDNPGVANSEQILFENERKKHLFKCCDLGCTDQTINE